MEHVTLILFGILGTFFFGGIVLLFQAFKDEKDSKYIPFIGVLLIAFILTAVTPLIILCI